MIEYLQRSLFIDAATGLFKLVGNAAELAATRDAINAIIDWLGAKVKIGSIRTAGLSRQTVFNVLDYGAVGNGTTNDHAAITAAINAAAQSGGGRVFFPALTNTGDTTNYATHAPIEIKNDDAHFWARGISLVGDANKRVAIVYTGQGNVNSIIDLRSRDCTIEDLAIYNGSPGTTVQNAIEMTAASDSGPGAVSTANKFIRVTISAYDDCTLVSGLRSGEQVNGWWPSNLDFMEFHDVTIQKCTYCIYTRNQNANQIAWELHGCKFGFSSYGIYVDDPAFLGFNCYETGLTRISEAAFRLRQFTYCELIDTDIEYIKRLLIVAGPTSAAFPFKIDGMRAALSADGAYPPYDIPADGTWIDFGCPGPLTIMSVAIVVNGFGLSNFNIKMTGPNNGSIGSVATLITMGCQFPQIASGISPIFNPSGGAVWMCLGCSLIPTYPNAIGSGTQAADSFMRQYGLATQVDTTLPLAFRASRFGDTESNVIDVWCNGDPNGSVVAPVGSRAKDRNSANTYRKNAGIDANGWVLM